ncbi:uncharacterized protein [Acropora muricata]|uniref:uncharacterized protein n=1 Tax=Acropora muricata TaxID=159855 RepID=UPI0034E5C5A9
MQKVLNVLLTLHLGKVETSTIPGNKSQVHFWVRTPVPENHDDAITFIQRMLSVGVNPEPTERHMKQIMKRVIDIYKNTTTGNKLLIQAVLQHALYSKRQRQE